MIKIQITSKSYGSKKVLNSIDLKLEKGKVYGLVGENGAGKTTLFRCIAGLEVFNGAVKSDFDTFKNHLGFLKTTPYFMSKITGWEYLKLLCIARKIKRDDFEEHNIFQLPLNQYAETYSTGMKKKLALFGLLLQGNEVYILDEPFNGVDIQSNMLIIEIIEKLRKMNKTIIISSHIFSTLKETCDEIHLLRKGSIVKSVFEEGFNDLNKEIKGTLTNYDLGFLNP